MSWKLTTKYKQIEMRKVYHDTIEELVKVDPKVVVLEADLANSANTADLITKYPNQCFNCGISESNMIAAAGGLSILELKPYVHSFAPFVTRRVLDQIFMSIAYSKNHIHIYGSDPGIYSQANGGTHTSFEDFSVLRAIPNFIIFAPSDSTTFRWMINEYNLFPQPTYTRAPRGMLPEIYEESSTFKIGEGQWIYQGDQIAVIALGDRVQKAIEIRNVLIKQGISISVVDLMFIKPFDHTLLQEIIKQHSYIITYENHSIYGGIGDIVTNEIIASKYSPQLIKLGINDEFGEAGDLDYLEKKFRISSFDLLETIKSIL